MKASSVLLILVSVVSSLQSRLLGQVADDFSAGLVNWYLLDTNINLNPDGTPVLDVNGSPVAKPWGPGVFDTSTGVLHMTTTGTLPPNNDPNVYDVLNTGFMAPLHLGSLADPILFANGIYRSTLRIDSPATGTSTIIRGNPVTFSAYVFYASAASGEFGIARYENGSEVRNEIVPNLTYGLGESWNLVGTAIGNQLSLTAWKVGDPEPLTPQLTITDNVFAAGAVGLGAGLVSGATWGEGISIDVTRDDFSFSPLPVPEPSTLGLLWGVVCGVLLRRRGLIAGRGQPHTAPSQDSVLVPDTR